jgi:hypothetical protein
VGKTSRHGSRDLVASRVKCGLHGGKNGKMKSRTVSWLSLKTKVEPGLRGAKLGVVIGGGYIKFAGFAVGHQKTIGLLR